MRSKRFRDACICKFCDEWNRKSTEFKCPLMSIHDCSALPVLLQNAFAEMPGCERFDFQTGSEEQT